MRRGLLIGGIGLLAIVAVAGWVRQPAQPLTPATAPYTYNLDNAAARPTTPAPVAAQPVAPARPVATGAAPRPQSRTVSERRYVQSGPVYKKRSTKKSVAIVGGSAAAGAAIGAIAGGGKGAAIGALAGGGGGFVYDRMTRKKRVDQ